MTAVEKAAAYVVEIARKEVGYREKASNSQLDDKTANAGSNNYTKYAAYFDQLWNSGIRWYNTRKQTGDWCDMFFDWCQCQAWGWETARKVVYQPMESCGAGCEFSADYYRGNGTWIPRSGEPKPGDQIFFGPVGDETHTGMVVGVTSATVNTIEGNSGNRCAEHSYARSDGNIAGYGRPDYALVAYKFVDNDTPIEDDKESGMSENEIKKLFEQERKDRDKAIEKALDDALGPMIKNYDEIPWEGVKNEVREMVEMKVIDGGTDETVNPNDVNMRLQLLRVLVVGKRFSVKAIAKSIADKFKSVFKS